MDPRNVLIRRRKKPAPEPVYTFTVGPSPNFRPHTVTRPSLQEARTAARELRRHGWSTSRVRRQ